MTWNYKLLAFLIIWCIVILATIAFLFKQIGLLTLMI